MSQSFKTWPLRAPPPSTPTRAFRRHYVTLLQNKAWYYVPSVKGTSGLSFYLLNESIRIMSVEKNHRQQSPADQEACVWVHESAREKRREKPSIYLCNMYLLSRIMACWRKCTDLERSVLFYTIVSRWEDSADGNYYFSRNYQEIKWRSSAISFH